jgi:Inner membrane component domain
MCPISVLLNLLWIIFGGLWMAVGWMIAAVVMAITIIGLPWTRAAFNIGVYTLLPFGQKAVSRAFYGQHDLGTGPLGVLVQCLMANPGRLVVGVPSPHHSDHAGYHHCGHPVRLSACETSGACIVANREDDRTCLTGPGPQCL